MRFDGAFSVMGLWYQHKGISVVNTNLMQQKTIKSDYRDHYYLFNLINEFYKKNITLELYITDCIMTYKCEEHIYNGVLDMTTDNKIKVGDVIICDILKQYKEYVAPPLFRLRIQYFTPRLKIQNDQ